MYPQAELTRLAAHKAALRRDIAGHRAQCAAAAARLSQPLAWIDQLLSSWRKMAPLAQLAAVPLAFLATRTAFPRLKFIAPLVRWAPTVVSVANTLGALFKVRP
ncbi:MAG: hypothetical protein JNL39_06690 [Opitutaceae bacterium]|nr:hypothetical protein [Opitutaceae bacterium]